MNLVLVYNSMYYYMNKIFQVYFYYITIQACHNNVLCEICRCDFSANCFAYLVSNILVEILRME